MTKTFFPVFGNIFFAFLDNIKTINMNENKLFTEYTCVIFERSDSHTKTDELKQESVLFFTFYDFF